MSTRKGLSVALGSLALIACGRACGSSSSSSAAAASASASASSSVAIADAATKVAPSASAIAIPPEVEARAFTTIPLFELEGPFPSIDEYCAAHIKIVSKTGQTPRRCKVLESAGIAKNVESFASVKMIETPRERGMADTFLLALEAKSGFYVTTEAAWIYPLNGSNTEPLGPLHTVAREGILVVTIAFEDVFGRDNGVVGGLIAKLESSTVCTITDPPACSKPLPTARRSISVETPQLTVPPDAPEWDVHVTVQPISRTAVRLVHEYGPFGALQNDHEPGLHPLTAPATHDAQ